ncbi:MAG: hypothetical protein IPO30_14515 [Hyphomonadaceae bacterium]|nr:hypothetical protein [Hyphomonadaceae bacterium]
MRATVCFGLLVLAAGCAAAPAPAQAIFCVAEIRSFSNPDAGARGDFGPNVRFADVQIGSKAVGYGAAGGRSDEITIADGVLHLARPNGAGSHRQRIAAASGEGAYMLQLINVEGWRAPSILPVIPSLDALGAEISDRARAAGCGGPAKLAYRIEGRVRRAEWSLDTLPQRGDFVSEGQDVVIVGLFATVEQGRHFVPEGRNIHAHAVLPGLDVAGHLKALELEPGARLQLQAR